MVLTWHVEQPVGPDDTCSLRGTRNNPLVLFLALGKNVEGHCTTTITSMARFGTCPLGLRRGIPAHSIKIQIRMAKAFPTGVATLQASLQEALEAQPGLCRGLGPYLRCVAKFSSTSHCEVLWHPDELRVNSIYRNAINSRHEMTSGLACLVISTLKA